LKRKVFAQKRGEEGKKSALWTKKHTKKKFLGSLPQENPPEKKRVSVWGPGRPPLEKPWDDRRKRVLKKKKKTKVFQKGGKGIRGGGKRFGKTKEGGSGKQTTCQKTLHGPKQKPPAPEWG